jgi:hypothetical protein
LATISQAVEDNAIATSAARAAILANANLIERPSMLHGHPSIIRASMRAVSEGGMLGTRRAAAQS